MGLIERELRNVRTKYLFECLVLTFEPVNYEIEYGNACPLSKALVRSLGGPLRSAKKNLSGQQPLAID